MTLKITPQTPYVRQNGFKNLDVVVPIPTGHALRREVIYGASPRRGLRALCFSALPAYLHPNNERESPGRGRSLVNLFSCGNRAAFFTLLPIHISSPPLPQDRAARFSELRLAVVYLCRLRVVLVGCHSTAAASAEEEEERVGGGT